ncbi:Ada metal-binding domain-containing protein [Chryseobacterium gallinarum]|uniref:Ada metal-binding domain-containing protein n=1 Tax=Chryseobacterium gallinarum TaxID=1324352 RepID=UPI0009E39086|nr:Ada metal-binding domain-containing protein [Chryseobacterium gallinarum]
MIYHTQLSDSLLRNMIRRKEIRLGGNKKLKIYGTLRCTSGKRMKKENRVFFLNEQQALQHHYRPCAHCMREEYKKMEKRIRSKSWGHNKLGLNIKNSVHYPGFLRASIP